MDSPRSELDSIQEALWTAVRQGTVKDLNVLVAKPNIKIEEEDPNGDRPLHLASTKGHVECVRLLVKKGANLNSQGMYGNTAIMKAGYWGKFEVLKYLLLMGADLEAKNDDGMTALILTAKDNKLECVKFLLERGADLKAKSNHGCTALIASSENGHLEVVQLLVEKGRVTLDDQDEDQWSALYYAARNGHKTVVVFLVHHGASIGLKDKKGQSACDVAKNDDIKAFLNDYERNMSTDLIQAAAKGNIKDLEAILSKAVSVEMEDIHGDRALHVAAKGGHLEVVTLLKNKGADLNSKGSYGNTALIKASYWGKFEVVKALRFWGADIEAQNDDGLTALILAAQDGKFIVVKYLVEQGCHLETKSLIGWTALMSAIAHTEVARFLVDRGAQLNVQDEDGWTALELASRGGNFGTVVLLCEAGADITLTDKHGLSAVDVAKTESIKAYLLNFNKQKDSGLLGACRSGNIRVAIASIAGGAKVDAADDTLERPLHIAAKHGFLEITKLLVEKQADINAKGMYGNSALMKAAYWGMFEVAKYLQCMGADKEQTNDDGLTALHLAAQDGRYEVVKYLLEQGARVDARNPHGWTPLTFASNFGHLEVVKYLWFRGADVNIKDTDGMTPVYFAGRNGHIKVVRFLATAGADIESEDNEGKNLSTVGKTPILRAMTQRFSFRKDLDLLMDARSGAVDDVIAKIKDGANVEIEDVNGDRPMHLAAKNGHVEVVKVLFRAGADPNSLGMYGNTPIIKAAYWGKFEVCKLLLQFCGSNLEQKNDDGLTALLLASQDGKVDVIKFLIDWGCELETTSNIGWTALMCAAAYGHLHVVKLLFFKKARFDVQDMEGWTALHLASRNGHIQIAQFLLTVGADVDKTDFLKRTPLEVAKKDDMIAVLTGAKERAKTGSAALHRLSSIGDTVSLKQFLAEFAGHTDEINVDTGDTALHSAAQAGYQDSVRCLLEKSSNATTSANAVGWYNETPLHRAAGNGHYEVVVLLKEFGATMDVFNEDGSTPFALACLHGDQAIVKYMFESGASPSLHMLRTLDDSTKGVTIGWTPISAAASRGHIAVIKYLHETCKVDLNTADADGWTAVHFAARNGHYQVVEYLKSVQADIRFKDKKGLTAFDLAKTKDIAMLLWYGEDSVKEDILSAIKRALPVSSKGMDATETGPTRPLYEVLDQMNNSGVEDVAPDQKGLSRRLLSEYLAIHDMLKHIRVSVLDASIASATEAKNQRLSEALQHERNQIKVATLQSIGDYPDKANVTKRLNKLYVEMEALKEELVKAGKTDYAAENEAAMTEMKSHANDCLTESEDGAGNGAALAHQVVNRASFAHA